VTGPSPVAAPAAGEPGRNLSELQDVIIAQIETVPPLPVPPVDRKISADDIVRPKSLSVRGKQAERLYRAIILRVARRHKVDPAMVKAIIMAESSFPW
jgi:soluble lytic murein transglycosylase-like protein